MLAVSILNDDIAESVIFKCSCTRFKNLKKEKEMMCGLNPWLLYLLAVSLYARYVESAQSLSRETNIDLNRYEVCDNVDLETVLMEYESFYYIKFARYPKITKKLSQSGRDCLVFFDENRLFWECFPE